MDWWGQLTDRVVPVGDDLTLATPGLVIALMLAAVTVGFPPVWRVVRIVVTLVHELGHAFTGVLGGRRFSGFVLRGDMSGHAVTYGRPTGTARVVSTWAGYPAPAVVGAVMVWLAAAGWGAPLLALLLALLVVSLVRVRSGLTALVVVAATAVTGALWWWGPDRLQAEVLIGVGVLLVAGAWRHLAAVLRDRSRQSDPGVLADLTHVPRLVWNATFVIVCAAASWLAAVEVLALVVS
ncbi:MAG: M50 family metallopeptidase [Terracoccus sp.]